jgi:hypothetical protein
MFAVLVKRFYRSVAILIRIPGFNHVFLPRNSVNSHLYCAVLTLFFYSLFLRRKLCQIFTKEELEHTLLPIKGVIESWVLEVTQLTTYTNTNTTPCLERFLQDSVLLFRTVTSLCDQLKLNCSKLNETKLNLVELN